MHTMTMTSFQTHPPAALSAWDALSDDQIIEVRGTFARMPVLKGDCMPPWSSAIEGVEIDPVIANLMMNGGVK